MNLQKFNEGLKEIEAALKKINNIKNDKNKELSIIDSKISDIYHYIENYNYNAVQGAKVLKLLKQNLKDRRNIKNELATIEGVLTSLSCNFNKNTKKIQKYIKSENDIKKYLCRTEVLKDSGIYESKTIINSN